LDDLPKLKELEEISPIKPEDSEEISELTIDVSNDSLLTESDADTINHDIENSFEKSGESEN
jgi:hypothetical protein